MKTAFVLGAGLGTRLKTLTQQRPKPLIPVANRPLITYAFDHLLAAGFERFVVNTHWRGEVYPETFPDGQYRGAPLHFRHEAPEVLETAGGIKNAQDLIGNDPFIVYNGDIFTNLPLGPAIDAHRQLGCEVTMVLRSKDGPLQVSWDPQSSRVTDIGQRLHPSIPAQFLFTGIYLVNPGFFDRIPAGQKLSVVPIFMEMIRSGDGLGGVVIDDGHWWDLGTREQYLAVHQDMAKAAPWIDPSAHIAPDAKLSGATAIGPGAQIGARSTLHDCIVWQNARIAPDCHLHNCIVTADAHVQGSHSHADL